MGVAGAELAGRSILITGLAGLLAGSLSMALGEWLSVQSSRELYAHQISIERDELLAAPEEEAEELALIYQAKGIPAEQARELAQRLVQDHDAALDTLSREELGIDPQELGGSAWVAAATSFLLFSAGAIVPVLPFFVAEGIPALIASVILSMLALFTIGAAITIITGRSALQSGLPAGALWRSSSGDHLRFGPADWCVHRRRSRRQQPGRRCPRECWSLEVRILIIEDEPAWRASWRACWSKNTSWLTSRTMAQPGLELALGGTYDGLIVDWMLPGQDGLQIIRALHTAKIDTPALLLTARGEVPQRVEGLNAGADDYLSKPFAFEELLARLHALLRRGQRPAPGTGDHDRRSDHQRCCAHGGAQRAWRFPLSPTEFAVLELLVRNRGHVITRDQLLERVWGTDADPQGNVVELYIHYLRRKLGTSGAGDPIIRTVRGSGYLIAES